MELLEIVTIFYLVFGFVFAWGAMEVSRIGTGGWLAFIIFFLFWPLVILAVIGVSAGKLALWLIK